MQGRRQVRRRCCTLAFSLIAFSLTLTISLILVPFIREGCVKACIILVRLCEQEEIALPDFVLDQAETIEDITVAADISGAELSKTKNACEMIWGCQDIKDAVDLSLKQTNERLQMATNDPFFLNSLDKIFADNYLPSNEDMLLMRRSTSGR